MNEPRQLSPVQLDIDSEVQEGDFTPRREASPKASSAPAFVETSPSDSPPPPESSSPLNSVDSISTPQSSEPESPSPSAETSETSASAEKAPTPMTDIPIRPSENPIPLVPKSSVAAPPPVS